MLNVKDFEDELKMIGENMKALEVAGEKALIIEDNVVLDFINIPLFRGQIFILMEKLKIGDQKLEYEGKNINKENHRS